MVLFTYMVMCIIFGTTFFAIKIGLEAGLSPYFSAGIRFVLAGGLVMLFCYFRGMTFPSTFSSYKKIFVIGCTLTTGTFSTLYWGEQYIPSSLAALLSALGPMMVTLLMVYKTKEMLSRYHIIGLLVGFVGVLMITLPAISFSLGAIWLIACIAVITGQLFYSLGTVRSKELLQSEISPFILNGLQMLFGGSMLLVLSLLTEKPDYSALTNLPAALSLFYLTIIGSIVGHSIYYLLIKKTNPSFPATWLYVSPFIALALDLGIRNEPITWFMVLGGVCIVSGVIIMNRNLLGDQLQVVHTAIKQLRSKPASENANYETR